MNFNIKYGSKWTGENGVYIFKVTDTNKTPEIIIETLWNDIPDGAYSPRIVGADWNITRDDGTPLVNYTPSGRKKIKFNLSQEDVGSYTAKIKITYQYRYQGDKFPTTEERDKETTFKIEADGNNGGDDGNETGSTGDDTFSLPFTSTNTNVHSIIPKFTTITGAGGAQQVNFVVSHSTSTTFMVGGCSTGIHDGTNWSSMSGVYS